MGFKRLLSRPSLWTILSAIAGVIGAGAAVYSLLIKDEQHAVLTYIDQLDLVRIETFSEPIVLTGNWYVQRGAWWNAETLSSGDAVVTFDGFSEMSLEEVRIPPNSRKVLHVDLRALQSWVTNNTKKCEKNRQGGVQCKYKVVKCSPDQGEVQLGVEYTSRSGIKWARRLLPYCIESE